MTSNSVPGQVEASRLTAHLHAAGSGETVSYQATVTEDRVELETSGERSVLVLGADLSDREEHIDDGPHVITGIVEKFIAGQNEATSYLVLDEVTDVSPLDHELGGEDDDGQTRDDSDNDRPDTEGEPAEDDSTADDAETTSNRRPDFTVGKEVRTDRGDERISGKNPFADTERLKDTGIHQGGL